MDTIARMVRAHLPGATLAAAVLLGTAGGAAAPARAGFVDFESPPLGALNRMTIDPYTAPGVTFTTVTEGDVGIVKNSATSACVDPADANQKLGSAPTGGAVGMGPKAIRATFSPPLAGEVNVSVEFQTGSGETIRLRLLNPAGGVVATSTAIASPDGGTCGFPGGQRARTVVGASKRGTVASAIMDVSSNTSSIFVLDDFRFSGTRVAVREGSDGALSPTLAFGVAAGRDEILSVFPNPVLDGEARILLGLPSPRPVDLAVYDVTGRRVARVISGAVVSGQREFVWDGRDENGRPVARGTYFLHLEAGDLRETRRIVLAR